MNFYFTLDDIEIEEPTGFADIELSIVRDDKYHGMTYEASTSTLNFYGIAAKYLKAKKELEGVKAKVIFTAYVSCNAYESEELLSGRLNFGKYKETCGNECTVQIPWEVDSCQVILNARFDQKIDMDKNVAADGLTGLVQYPGLAVDTTLLAHQIKVGAVSNVKDEGDVLDLEIFANYGGRPAVRPVYENVKDESLQTSEFAPASFASSDNGLNDEILSPQILLESDLSGKCYNGVFNYETRLKGSFDIQYVSAEGDPIPDIDLDCTNFNIMLGKGVWGTFPPPDEQPNFQDKGLVVLGMADIPQADNDSHWVGTFDVTFSGTVTLLEGEGLYNYIVWQPVGPVTDIRMVGNFTFDKETLFSLTGVQVCPPTTSELYFIHEALSRATESITNGCIRVKSQYYGRTDSQPFSFPTDGCGGLRGVTSGLKIRKAPEDNFFSSLQDLIEGLNPIDNIGYDIVDEGGLVMRIEDVDFFYQQNEIFRHDFVPEASSELEENKFYNTIDVGYKRWEVESVNGLGEINSNRQYNTSIDTINAKLDITSDFITGTFPIEITREQSFAVEGGADNKYDNEIFLICLKRTVYGLEVEQGNISDPENIFSPQTVYNYRISPVRNLMRWYKTIVAGFTSLYDSASQLFFGSGTANLIAKGMQSSTDCRIENAAIRENQNIFVTNFTDPAEATPIWKNELISYEYPMSVKDYNAFKLNPYGYISVQCGGGEFEKAYVKEIKFKIVKGTATFILRKKYAI